MYRSSIPTWRLLIIHYLCEVKEKNACLPRMFTQIMVRLEKWTLKKRSNDWLPRDQWRQFLWPKWSRNTFEIHVYFLTQILHSRHLARKISALVCVELKIKLRAGRTRIWRAEYRAFRQPDPNSGKLRSTKSTPKSIHTDKTLIHKLLYLKLEKSVVDPKRMNFWGRRVPEDFCFIKWSLSRRLMLKCSSKYLKICMLDDQVPWDGFQG
uniref:Uncharacterized protein n=1 Tax=Romanomermis culicivorax TaxID=13658 RepID=A0A915IVL6_ROMCU